MAKMKKKKINVYENNVYYKAGPYTRYNHTKIVKILRRLDSTEPIVTQYTLGKGFRKYRVKVIEVQKKEVAH
jgi:hypothetical protein